MSDISTEDLAKIAMFRVRLSQLRSLEDRVQRMISAVNVLRKHQGNRTYQLQLLAAARRYADESLDEAPNQATTIIRSIRNELTSLREGVYAETVTVDDFVLNAGRDGVVQLKTLRSKIEGRIAALEDADHEKINAEVIASAAELKKKMPVLGDREFVLGRAPIVFSLATKQGHTNVGYLNVGMLERTGFRFDNLAGYTVLHDQHVIGVPHKSPNNAQPALERAALVKAAVEAKTNRKYEFVSDKPTPFRGGVWFWVMSSANTRQLVQAFPGAQLKINTWGFSF